MLVPITLLLLATSSIAQLTDLQPPRCDGDTCYREVRCESVSGFASSRGRSDETTTVSGVLSNSSSLTKSISEKDSSLNYTSSSAAADELVSTPLAPTEDASRRKRSPEAERCFVVFQKNGTDDENHDENENKPERLVNWQVWLYGFLSVGFISLSGIFGIIFVPLMKKKLFVMVMRYLVGLGIGALSSTAIFQLIPECFQIMETDYLAASVVIWITIWVFFVFECFCKILLSGNGGHHGHSHSRNKELGGEKGGRPIYKGRADIPAEVDNFLPKSFNNGEVNIETDHKYSEAVPMGKINKENKMAFHHRSHDYLAETDNEAPKLGVFASISSVAWMIILGDGIHNFIDGVSIGAGFTQSPLTGLSISLAIVFEEFPHELGDFAILINSGMSVKKALAFNFASACTAFLGLVLGISLESFEVNSYIFGLAGGLFLYISLSDLIPQLNLMLDEALEEKHCAKKNALLIMLQQNLGILTGMVLIYLITRYTDQLTFEN
ncbi:metal cation symporter ZIP8-like [Cloeon dipterum]|uniref:metal cation symporter ZIP8-like n=1 Tax=Cloeon dipterum TaxID=197152 RepID=UPI00322059EF